MGKRSVARRESGREVLRPLYLVQAPYKPAPATVPNARFEVVSESMPGNTHRLQSLLY